MSVLHKSKRLKKELTLFGVYAIATGTTLSAGFFLMPSLAVQSAGPAVILSYVIAAALLVPAALSIVELATAMPRAGGAYYFLDRSLGPLAGTVGGLGTWLALVLKSAFALVGMGFYIALLGEMAGITLLESERALFMIAAALAVLFGVVNMLGAKRAGALQILLVIGLLAILVWFIFKGSTKVSADHFDGFLGAGFGPIVATAGTVFISYVGVTNIASVAEEVKNPQRNLPLGIFLALGTAVLEYVLGVGVMVGVLGTDDLARTYTPVEMTANEFAGNLGVGLVIFAAMLAFSSVANAGILAASRYPLAMGRDHLVPRPFQRLSSRGTPTISIAFTVAAIIVFLLLLPDPMSIAKLASAFQLLMFGLLCLAVIVMRESGLESYDPSFRSPLYPWIQLAGIVAPICVILMMGLLPILFSAGMVVVGIVWYRVYARSRVERHGAIYHVFEKLGQKRYAGLDRELRSILKEKGLREHDPFEEVVARADVIGARPRDTFERIAKRAAKLLAQRLPCTAEELVEGFLQGTMIGATPVTGGVALPHLRIGGIDLPYMVLVRCPSGVLVSTGDPSGGGSPLSADTYAIFFLVSPDRNPSQHLRLLAELAGRVDQEGFIGSWLAAEDEHRLKEILLRSDRYLSMPVVRGTASEPLIGRPLREAGFPDGCLVAIIRREGETIVPRGGTEVREGDWLTVIGSSRGIRELRDRFGVELPGSGDP